MSTQLNAEARAFPIVIVGHVDHGKSTLIGRLLHDTGTLPEGKVDELRRMSQRRGVAIEWSFALDALQLERDQAITVDSSQIWFQSAFRRYVIIDAPGHREFLRNMITGAAQAEAAVIVVDAVQGATDQTKRHCYLLHLLGVTQVVVAINKMDKVDFRSDVFHRHVEAVSQLLNSLGLHTAAAIPVSAREGDNLATSSPRIPWWSGATLLEALDALKPQPLPVERPLRFTVQDVYRTDQRRTIVGRIESGRLKVGDTVSLWPTGQRARVQAFEAWNTAAPILSVEAPHAAAFSIDRDLFVERGHVATSPDAPPRHSNAVRARLVWLASDPLVAGKSLRLRLGTASVAVTVSAIHRALEVDELSFRADRVVATNDIAEVTLTASRPLSFDLFHEHQSLGRGVLIDGFDVVAGCVIDDDASVALRSDMPSAVFWLTGLSGAGKSTLADGLRQKLVDQGRQVVVLDGDDLRRGLNSDLGYSAADRTENLRRAAEVAKFLAGEGMIVIAAFITPLVEDRRKLREIIGPAYHEIFVNADLATCENRDVKGLYAKARAGEVANFTGISAVWERPVSADLTINSDCESYAQSLDQLWSYVASALTPQRFFEAESQVRSVERA